MKKNNHFLLVMIFLLISFLLGYFLFNFNSIKENFTSTVRPNIILITLESTRADHLPCYGYGRNTTPNICEVAEDGVLFENAISQSSWTLPSLSSLLTSKYTTVDIPDNFIMGGGKWNLTMSESVGLSKNLTTIAEYMKRNNYKTYAVTAAPFAHKIFNLDQGFDKYIDKVYRNTNSEEVLKTGSKFLNKSDKNFFIWFHLPNSHQGYDPPSNFSGMYSSEFDSNISSDHVMKEFQQMNLSEEDIKYIRARYDEELKYADFSIGKFLRKLKNKGLYKNSLIFLTADHGEDLRNNGHIGHGTDLYEELIHVPFIVKFPGNKYSERKIEEVAGHIDIFPTISESLGKDMKNLERIDLRKVIKNENINRKGILSILPHRAFCYRTENWKLIGSFMENSETGRSIKWELYNLSEDPQENYNIFKENNISKIKLNKAKRKIIKSSGSKSILRKNKISDELKQRLHELGYIR